MNDAKTIDPFAPAVIAADYTVAAVGRDAVPLLLTALRAGWMTDDEAEQLHPFAEAIAWISGVPLPSRRDG